MHSAGPSWNLDDEYADISGAGITDDLAQARRLMDDMLPLQIPVARLDAPEPAVAAAQSLYRLSMDVGKLLGNVSVYCSCRLSVNSRDNAALEMQGSLQADYKRFGELSEPLSQFTNLADDALIEAYLQDPDVAPAAFQVRHNRQRRHELLSLSEENLINGLGQDGIHAWGKLYDQLSGTIKCDVVIGNEPQQLGVAEASGLLTRADERLRRDAWQSINNAWEGHEEACAASINAIAGWRLELNRKRGTQQPVHFLDNPAHQNRIGRDTLDTLMQVAKDSRPLAQRAAKLQGRAYGKATIGPWDMRAPAPELTAGQPGGKEETPIAFADAIELIADAYARVDPSMGDFVHMMVKQRWVEGTVGDSKRPGAYCTGFPKSRHPRVYMTYTGGTSDVITLAHELGHGLHSWVMRDLPDSQRSYGMSLAETASTFGETLVRDALLANADSAEAKLKIAWEEISALTAFLLNIPARFEFERRFYESRAERPLRAGELKTLMSAAWETWYGDALAEPDPMFWASKLHFYISSLSFYNFPYLFGYLFSLGVYAQRDAFPGSGPGGFYQRYESLLRDTGRMTAEDLARTHLDVDLTSTGFWQNTVAALEPRVDAFEKLLDELRLEAPAS